MENNNDTGDMKKLGYAAIAVVALAVIVVTGIAVLTGYTQVGTYTVINNTTTIFDPIIENATVQLFITGLKIFGTFIGVIVLAVIGKAIIKLFK